MKDAFGSDDVVTAAVVPRIQAGTARAEEQKMNSKIPAVMEDTIIVSYVL